MQEEFTEDWSLASQNVISPRGGSDVVWSDKIPLVSEEEMWQLCDPPAGAALQLVLGSVRDVKEQAEHLYLPSRGCRRFPCC